MDFSKIKTRVSICNMHDDLTSMCESFLAGFDFHRDKGLDGDYSFELNWHRMHHKDVSFCVGVDEDVFLINPQSLLEIIDHMQRENIVMAGMPEKGVCSGRNFSARYLNPYFVIYNCDMIRNMEINKEVMFNYDSNVLRREACWGINSYLEDGGGKILRFKGYDLEQFNPAVVLTDLNDKPFLYHTWYARDWDSIHKIRIQNIFELAKKEYEKNI